MPKTKWDKLIAAAVKQHCTVKGMTKEEIEKTLEKAGQIESSSSGDRWTYVTVNKKECLKYDGDNCVQFRQDEDKVYFTPDGFSQYDGTESGCMNEPLFSLRLSLKD